MRLWTVHPRYLDTKGLLAVWREGLLAQKVLLGQTRGYKRHPQLHRFRLRPTPVACIAVYLREIADEADRRGYKFNRTKISVCEYNGKLIETRDQLRFEWSHLKRKLRRRSPSAYRICCKIELPQAHPLFRIVPGPIQDWEKRESKKQIAIPVSKKRRRENDGKSRASFRSWPVAAAGRRDSTSSLDPGSGRRLRKR